MSIFRFASERDRDIALEVETKVIERRGWKPPHPCLTTSIPDELERDVRSELDKLEVFYRVDGEHT